MRRSLLVSVFLLTFLFPAAAAHADDVSAWAFSIGSFELVDERFEALELGVEYRFDSFPFWFLELQPVVGISGTDEEAIWGYGGFRQDLPTLGDRWVPTIGFAVALYENGDGKDLGGVLEFRSSIDIAYQWDDGSRLGLSFYHLSNASIYESNPGSESLVLTYSFRR
ncbi:MAG: acyloxyacyl hydrolase [Acidobacteriota bacterium]